MLIKAAGTFEVKLESQPQDDFFSDENLSRRSIDKQFEGDLKGFSKGYMLSATSIVKGSAGYVAIEKVSGQLQGKSGTFILQHNAKMTRGEPEQNIIVIPDSGTDELEGLTGTMRINISDGQHLYDFEYSFDKV